MRIVGSDFFGGAVVRGDGRVIKADRALSFLVGKSLRDVLAQAGRVNGKIELSSEECQQLAGSENPPSE